MGIRYPDFTPVSFIWVFSLKPLDAKGKKVLHKARFCVHEDLQNPSSNYNSNSLYAPVASRESIRVMFALVTASGLVVQEGNVSNAYLYGNLDFPITSKHPTGSLKRKEYPGHVFRLTRSMYALKQAGAIWISLLMETVLG